MQYQLRFSGQHYNALQQHLFPGDGQEAVAIVLCGRHEQEGISLLLSYKLECIPHDACERDEQFVNWKTERINPLLEEAAKGDMAVLKIHSHPGGSPKFSETDNQSDRNLFPAVFGWAESDKVHGSAVMLPDGKVFGRVFTFEMEEFPFSQVSVAGDVIETWRPEEVLQDDSFALRTRQAFGEKTYSKLKNLKVGIVGCSGTGSPVIEQLVRLGVGELVLVDPDQLEEKNLNRILNSTRKDALEGKLKTDMLAERIRGFDLGTKISTYSCNLYNSKGVLRELILCDVVFGCMDSVDGRHLLNQLANFYHIPYFDIGVKLVADGKGGVNAIVGSVHYLQPGKSSLLSRGLYTPDQLAAESLKRTNPEQYHELLKEGYISGANVESPAVISINMQISSMAVNEFLNRIHLFKDEDPGDYAKVMLDYCAGCIENVSEEQFEADLMGQKFAGYGDCKPFLRMTELDYADFKTAN